MRRGLLHLALIGFLLSLAVPAMGAADEWEFDGGGWGHGVGMSQFGARAMAANGHTAEQIIGHYYKGATVANGVPANHWTTQPEKLLVGIRSNVTNVSLGVIGSPIPLPCRPGQAHGCVDDVWMAQPGESWVYEADQNPENAGMCRFRQPGVGNTGWLPCGMQLRIADGNTNRIIVAGREYAHGVVRFDPISTTRFHVVLGIDLEKYLLGLAEMPSYFGSEALKAQAITGRSYALATAINRGGSNGSQKLSSCGCHLRSTSDDQVYAGYSVETTAWRSAVEATAGKVATHPGSNNPLNLISTYYFSSSGGTTENVKDVWGGSAPWLQAVPDPWSVHPDAANPLANWTIVVPGPSLANHLGWDVVTEARVESPPPGALLRFEGLKDGKTVSTLLTGYQVRGVLSSLGYRRDGSPVRSSPFISGVRYTGRFIDAVDHLFESEITWLATEGITKGCNPPTNSFFCPEGKVTRGQMAAFLVRFLDLPSSSTDAFTDDNGHLFEREINALAAADITRGCNPPANTKFCPDDVIDRGQMAALLVRALGLPPSSTNHFTDDNGHLFEREINALADSGITRGCNPPTNDRFCASQVVTRGQMAAFLMRAADLRDG